MGKPTIKAKYFRAFIFIIILPIIVVGCYVYKGYNEALLDNISYKSRESINTISNQIEDESRNIQLILSTLVRDKISIINENKQLCELITLWNKENRIRERYELSKIIDNELGDIFSYINGMGSIVFYLEGGGFYFYGNYPEKDELLVRQENWYKQSIKKPGITTMIDSTSNFLDDKDTNAYFSAAIAPQRYLNKNDVELVYMNLKTNLFKGINENNDDINGNTIILDQNNKIIFSKNKEEIGLRQNKVYNIFEELLYDSGTVKTKVGNEKLVLYKKIIPKTGWKIINITYNKELLKSLNKVNLIAVGLVIIILIFFMLFSKYFFKGIIIPIQSLIMQMRKIKDGNLDVVVEVSRDDEIGELSDTFNIMVKDIKKLLKENKEKERMRSEAEMEALQAQINPHFISNTLSSIRFMAIISKMNNIREMTEAFINIVSASFNRNTKFTTIEKEIEMLKSYAYIMSVRHGNKYDIYFEVEDENIKEISILKMLVQPILENAILHGVSGLEEKGLIYVRFKLVNENLVVEVEDNGVGMDEETINRLLSIDLRNDKGFTSIGIKNVDKRVKLNFGNEYGIFVDSVEGEYTKITLMVPIIKNEGEVLNHV